MHALEKKALADPFLADALEGIANVSEEEFLNDLSVINKKIGRRKTAILFTPFRLAAGVVLLISSIFIIYQVVPKPEAIALKTEKEDAGNKKLKGDDEESNGKGRKLKSENEKSEPESAQVKAERGETKTKNSEQLPLRQHSATAINPSSAKSLGPEINPSREEAVQQLASAPASSEVKADADQVNAVAGESPKEKGEDKEIAAGAQPTTIDKTKKSFALSDARPRHVPFSSAKRVASRFISGRVVSAEDGTPLPGVTVMVRDSSAAAVTDLNGNYSISIGDDKGNLIFSFAGLQQEEEDASRRDHIDVQLKNDPTHLSVVVVTSTGTAAGPTPVIRLAEPEGGKKAYDEYLDSNLQYPQEALANNIKGKARIEFTVSEDGSLVDFQVIKKLGYGYEEEMMRLIKDGPKWNPTTENGMPVKSTIKVQFQFDPARFRK